MKLVGFCLTRSLFDGLAAMPPSDLASYLRGRSCGGWEVEPLLRVLDDYMKS